MISTGKTDPSARTYSSSSALHEASVLDGLVDVAPRPRERRAVGAGSVERLVGLAPGQLAGRVAERRRGRGVDERHPAFVVDAVDAVTDGRHEHLVVPSEAAQVGGLLLDLVLEPASQPRVVRVQQDLANAGGR